MTTPAHDQEPDNPAEGAERGTLERLVPELLKKVIDAGAKNLSPEAVQKLLSELKLPREALHHTFSQLDETKQGVYRTIAKEVRELFERTSLAEELAKALSLLSLEVKMEVRFKPTSLETKTKVTTQKAKEPEGESFPPAGSDQERR